MKLNNNYKNLIVGDFYQNLLTGFGISRANIKQASRETIKKCLHTTLIQHIYFHREDTNGFKIFFRKALSKEYKLGGLSHLL